MTTPQTIEESQCPTALDESTVVTEDGYILSEDGEIIGLAMPLPLGELTTGMTEDSANLIIRKIVRQEARAESAGLAMHQHNSDVRQLQESALRALEATPDMIELRALQRQADVIQSRALKTLEWLHGIFDLQLADYAKVALGNSKSRTLKLLSGNVSLRTIPAKVEVTDEDAALSWLEDAEVMDAIKKSVLISKIPKSITEQWLEKGETPDNIGFTVIRASEKVTVSQGALTGVKAL